MGLKLRRVSLTRWLCVPCGLGHRTQPSRGCDVQVLASAIALFLASASSDGRDGATGTFCPVEETSPRDVPGGGGGGCRGFPKVVVNAITGFGKPVGGPMGADKNGTDCYPKGRGAGVHPPPLTSAQSTKQLRIRFRVRLCPEIKVGTAETHCTTAFLQEPTVPLPTLVQ